MTRDRHAAKHQHPINMRVRRRYLIRLKELLDQKLTAKLFRGVTLDISWMRGVSYIHFVHLDFNTKNSFIHA